MDVKILSSTVATEATKMGVLPWGQMQGEDRTYVSAPAGSVKVLSLISTQFLPKLDGTAAQLNLDVLSAY